MLCGCLVGHLLLDNIGGSGVPLFILVQNKCLNKVAVFE